MVINSFFQVLAGVCEQPATAEGYTACGWDGG